MNAFGIAEGAAEPAAHIVNGVVISRADKEKILWRNAARFFDSDEIA